MCMGNIRHVEPDWRDYGAKDPQLFSTKEALAITLKVNPDGEQIKFFLFATRAYGKRVFWAKSCVVCSGRVYHRHRTFQGDYVDCEMVVSLVNSASAGGVGGKAALHCQPCGLRVLVPEDALSDEDLAQYFQAWNPDYKSVG